MDGSRQFARTTGEHHNLFGDLCCLAAKHGQKNALSAPGRTSLRFEALPGRLEQIRAELAAFGVGPGECVTAAMPRGPETTLCFLGVMACATLLPLNPEFSEAEFREHLSRVRPGWLVVPKGGGAAAKRAASALGIGVIELVTDPAGPAGAFSLDTDAPRKQVAPRWNHGDEFALVLMTSGSTGRPKLVPLRLRHLLVYARRSNSHLRVGPDDRFLQAMPLFHGHGVKSSIVNPILAGCEVVCPYEFTVEGFFRNLRDFDITWYSAGYAIHRAIYDRLDDYAEIVAKARLRLIRSGSGKLDPKVQKGLEAAFRAPMIERYGMSESGSLTSQGFDPEDRKPGTVGRPLHNSVAILGADGSFLGPNETGEVVCKGPSVFDGYLDDEELNKASFIDGWFRTGDLGHFDADGFLRIVGRVKDIINRGGEKVSPVEIEAVITEFPDVSEACVFHTPHPVLGEEIVAAVVPVPGRRIDPDALSDFVASRLALFKVPRQFVIMESLPKGRTGKIQRDAVAECAASRIARVQESAPPPPNLAATERRIAAIWQTVLNQRNIPRTEDFFLVGGDSLKAAEMMIAIKAEFGVDIALARIFGKESTIRRMAEQIDRALRASESVRKTASGVVPIKDTGSWRPIFVVPGHAGVASELRFLGQVIAPEQPLYGLDFQGLRDDGAPHEEMDGIVEDMISKIRSVQSSGPYFIAGLCFGGRVAFAVAQRLAAEGEHVARLIMLDPSPPLHNSSGQLRHADAARTRSPRRSYLAQYFGTKLTGHLHALGEFRTPSEGLRYLRERLYVLRDIFASGDPFRGNRIEINRIAVSDANKVAGGGYVPPRAYAGETLLFYPRDRTDRLALRYRERWASFLPRGAVYVVPGNHSGDMIRPPQVFSLAKTLNPLLETAQRNLKRPGGPQRDGKDAVLTEQARAFRSSR